MADNDIFLLRLNSFERNVKTSWQDMEIEKEFCDITLACEDKQIKTHKFIISSYSPVLKHILKTNSNPHPLIYLRRVKYKDLQNLLSYMYQGEVNIAEEDLSSFLEVAQDLNVKGLSERNLDGCNSKKEDSSQNKYSSNIDNSPKTIENIVKIENINKRQSRSSHSINEEVKSDEQFSNSNSDKDSSYVPALIQSQQITKHNPDEDTQQFIVSTLTGKQFMCGKCDKQYSKYSHLDRHTKSSHEGVQYACSKCDYKGTQSAHLKKHVMSIHEGYQYPCNQCDYKATQTSNLYTHQRKYHN